MITLTKKSAILSVTLVKYYILLICAGFIGNVCLAETLGQQECDSLTIAAASFMTNRNNGISQKSMYSTLPPLEQPEYKKHSAKYLLLVEMYQMAQEVFDHDGIDATTYMIFKSEYCLHKMNGEQFIDYDTAYPKLKLCGDIKLNNELIECAQNVGATM